MRACWPRRTDGRYPITESSYPIGLDAGETVTITVPADSAFVSVLRTVTAAVAARRDFTIEEIDDARIAIDEACALLLPHVLDTSAQLHVVFAGSPQRLEASVTLSRTHPGSILERTSYPWLVLAAVCDDVHSEQNGEQLTVGFIKSRGPRS